MSYQAQAPSGLHHSAAIYLPIIQILRIPCLFTEHNPILPKLHMQQILVMSYHYIIQTIKR